LSELLAACINNLIALIAFTTIKEVDGLKIAEELGAAHMHYSALTV